MKTKKIWDEMMILNMQWTTIILYRNGGIIMKNMAQCVIVRRKNIQNITMVSQDVSIFHVFYCQQNTWEDQKQQ